MFRERVRSKAGCDTCKLRRKKCDERKPYCSHCLRLDLKCTWVRATGERKLVEHPAPPQNQALPLELADDPAQQRVSMRVELTYSLSSRIDGVETSVDRFLLYHAKHEVDQSFAHIGHYLGEILLRLATSEGPSPGLMHTLLWLSATQIQARDAASAKVKQSALMHYSYAIGSLRSRIDECSRQSDGQNAALDDLAIAQTLVLCQEPLVKGQAKGEYTTHLNALRCILATQQKEWAQTPFRQAVVDFYIYQELSCAFTSLDRNYNLLYALIYHWRTTMAGLAKDLILCDLRIISLRRQIRRNRRVNLTPVIQPRMTAEAMSIMDVLRSWQPSREYGEIFYNTCAAGIQYVLIALLQTVSVNGPNSRLKLAVDTGIDMLTQRGIDSGPDAITPLPLFLVGVAASDASQRSAIENFLEQSERSRGPRAVHNTGLVLRRIWELMDQGSDDCWDWELVMDKMKLDFVVS